MFLQAIEEYVARKLEKSGCLGFIASAFFECLEDQLFFYLLKAYASIGQHHTEGVRMKGDSLDTVGVYEVEMTAEDHIVVFQQHDPFNTVAKFADVARPGMIQ